MFASIMDNDSYPGHSMILMNENYSWVDQRLRELYNNYALTSDNCDEYISSGLLNEDYAWVDQKLEQIVQVSEEGSILGKRKRAESDISDYDEEVSRAVKRFRYGSELPSSPSNSEIERERLRCQSPFPKNNYTFTPLSNPFCNLDCELYNYTYECSDTSSISSLNLESNQDDISANCSDYECVSELSNEDSQDVEYDSDEYYIYCANNYI
jgi:hypothetical protein